MGISSRFCMIFALLFLAATTGLQALDPAKCAKEVLFSFFPEPIVKEVMQKHNIPPKQIDAIVKELSQIDKQLIDTTEAKAAKLPQDKRYNVKEKKELFRQTMLEFFMKAMKNNGITDPQLAVTMLNEIQETRTNLFEECKKHAAEEQQQMHREEERGETG